ncbi:hypothetical protein AN1V17_02360 [Vallitalea sediminicola]
MNSVYRTYEMSQAQFRFWINEQLLDDVVSEKPNNQLLPFIIKGNLDVQSYEKALQRIMDRHESLRTFFKLVDYKPVQCVVEKIDLKVNYEDLTHLSFDKRDIYNLLKKDMSILFDLSKAPLFNVKLYKLRDKEHLCVLKAHHIITDAWSMDILANELIGFYHSFVGSTQYEPEELSIQYSDYSHWQNSLIKDGELDDQLNYWIKELSDDIQEVEFPFDYSRPIKSNYKSKMVPLSIDNTAFDQIKELSKKLNVSNYMFLLSVFNVLINKYTSCDDIIVGTSTSGRVHPELNSIIGCFVNTLPIKNNISSEDSFKEVLLKCKKKVLNLYDNQEIPFNVIVEKLNIPREEKNPIFNIIFELHNWEVENKYLDNKTNTKGLVFEKCDYETESSLFDIQFELYQDRNGMGGFIQYSEELYNQNTIERIAKNYMKLLKVIIKNIDIKISDIDIINKDEKQKLLYVFNSNQMEFSVDKCLHQLFESQVQKTQDRIAVSYEGKELTYEGLNKRANQIARLLRSQGIENNKFVAIVCDRSIEVLSGILGVFKAGGAYVPVDTSLPNERINYILSNSEASLVITQSKYIEKLKGINNHDSFKGYVCVDEYTYDNHDIEYRIFDKNYIDEQCEDGINNINDPTDLAYMIYTSGSTGMPKGALVRHNGMVNHIYGKIEELKITEEDIIVQNASISFDISVWQFLTAVLVGGKTSIVSFDVSREPILLFDHLKSEKITILEIVPSLLSAFLDMVSQKDEEDRNLKHLRWCVPTGEEVSVKIVNRWFEFYKDIKMVNAYGPTEASDDITHYIIDKSLGQSVERVPIGKPVTNMKIYIVDKNNKLVPIGVKGEICVIGIGVGAGYLKNTEKTNERFIKVPLYTESDYLMYKTGDLGRWLDDGNIEFFGRIDNQVKVRGFRIELEEIENVAHSYKDIDQLVAVIKKENNDNKIIGYFTSDSESLHIDEFKKYLETKIPYYMIPSKFIKIEKIPLTPNGKVNRKTLKKYSGGEEYKIEEEIQCTESLTETENKVIEIWKDVLSISNINSQSNFFEVGGHSVSALQVASRIKETFKIDILIRYIFANKTVKELGQYIDEVVLENTKVEVDENPIIKLPEEEYYELAPVQIPEWFLHELEPDNPFYNVTFDLMFNGELNIQAFEKSWQTIIKRHPVLRIYFSDIDGKPIQKVYPKLDFKVSDIFLDGKNIDKANEKEEIKKLIYCHANQIFDFRNGPLFSIKLIGLSSKRFLFLFTAHHIIWDETSSMNLMNEFNELYNAFTENREPKLPSLQVDYLDYARWMNNSINNGLFEKQKQYWLDKFSTVPDGLNLPTDYLRPAVQTFNGGTILKSISPELKVKVDEFCKDEDVTLYMLCLAVLNLQMYRLSQQNNFVIGSPIVNRDNVHLEKIIGLFASAIPLKCTIDNKDSFNDLLNKTKQTALKAYENHLYPSNLAIEEMNIKVDLSRAKLFNVFFGVQNDKNNLIVDTKFNGMEVDYKTIEFIENSSRFDITLAVDEIEGNIELNLNYNSDIFKKSTAKRMVDQYITLLEQIVEKPNELLNNYEMMSIEQRNMMLEQFNNTQTVFNEDFCIHHKFEQQAILNSEKIAVTFKDKSLSYKSLNEKANKLANHLINLGVKVEDKVGIVMEPSIEMIVGLLGILKAGAAYVPMAYDYPNARKKAIIDESEMKILLTCTTIDLENIDFDGQVVLVDSYWDEIGKCSGLNPNVQVKSNNLAYIIFTSGTTGTPKGIEIEHKGVVNLIEWIQNKYCLKDDESMLFITMFTFDASILDIYWPLAVGSKIVIADEEQRRNPIEIGKLVYEHNVTGLQFVPSMLDSFIDVAQNNEFPNLESLRFIICGGAILTRNLRDKLVNQFDCKIYNHYGPTEITVDAISFDCSNDFEGEVVPIGKPIANTKVYILDSNLKLAPIGVAGEIYIESIGSTRSYLNDIEKTQNSFIQSPFSSDTRLYKTGDVGKYLEDGNILFISRLDNQVKILGNRIELDEIENKLVSHELINKCAVVTNKDEKNEDRIVVYVELEQELNSFISRDNDVYKMFTVSQLSEFKDEIKNMHVDAWPEYFIGDETNKKYWGKLFDKFPKYQMALRNKDGDIVAVGNSIPICWEGTTETLPKGWDEGLEKGFIDGENNKEPNCLLVLAAVVDKKHQNKGLSTLILKAFKSLGHRYNLSRIIVPVRPTGKANHPEVVFEQWCERKRPDGMPEDNWLRIHERIGGKNLRIETQSQYVVGTIEEWGKWSGQDINESGEYNFKDTLQPVKIDMDKGTGEYYDPCVWMEHPYYSHEEYNWKYIDANGIKGFLRKYLPEYMVPYKFIFMTQIPLTPVGKIDKKNLPKVDLVGRIKTEFEQAKDDIEKALVKMWSEILDLENVSINDNFFEIGGQSLKATLLTSKIEKEFNVRVSLRKLFEATTIKEMSKYIKQEMKVTHMPIIPIEEREYYPTSSAQKRLYIINELDNNINYNITKAILIEGSLNKTKMEKAINTLINRHEALRTSFHMKGNEIVQKVEKNMKINVEYMEVDESIVKKVILNFIKPFNLSGELLFRASVIKLEENRHILLIDMHHIVVDGVSVEILIREFVNCYLGNELPQVKIQFKDFTIWQNNMFKSEVFKKQRAYWLDVFSGEIPTLNLPLDYERPEIQSFKGGKLEFYIEEDLIQGLNKVALECGTTMHTVLFAAYNVLLSKCTSDEDIIVGIPSAGRVHADIDSTVGMFVNTLAIRTKLSDVKEFEHYLKEVHLELLKAYENQDYQFEMLVEDLNINRDSGRNPIFDTMFSFQNINSNINEFEGLKFTPYEYEEITLQFELEMSAQETDSGSIKLDLKYCTKLFDEETIERLKDYYIKILNSIVLDKNVNIGEIEIEETSDKVIDIEEFEFDFE